MEGIGKDEDETTSKIATFIGVTSSTREEAAFFLESHNFDLESAIHSFFENAADHPSNPVDLNQAVEEEEEEEEVVAARSAVQTRSAAMASRENKKKKGAASGSGSGSGRIRTFADLNREAGPGSDSDDEGPQEYYTGGEKSGMLVQDPTRRGHDVDAIFDQARQMGAIQGPIDPNPSSSSRSFTGTGRLLSGETVPAAPRPPENVVHNIYFWSNGFTVNDGPLRRFEDPANAAFLESIKKSECPKELEPADRRSMVHVNLIKKGEDFAEPVRKQGSFQGVGRTLGGGSSSAQQSAAAVSSPSPATAVAAAAAVVVDDSRPATSIQLRLADGSRTVGRFNTHHTVGDIRSFINHHAASHGGNTQSAYALLTVGFPPKQLTDPVQTIEQAGLANSVVIQKLL